MNQNFELNKIAIFPNPSTGIFNISTKNVVLDKVQVTDVTGKIILTLSDLAKNNDNVLLNLSAFSNGIYFVKITSQSQSTVKRIIKK